MFVAPSSCFHHSLSLSTTACDHRSLKRRPWLIHDGSQPSLCHRYGRHLLHTPPHQCPALACPSLSVSFTSDVKAHGLPLPSSSAPAPRALDSSRCPVTADLHCRKYHLCCLWSISQQYPDFQPLASWPSSRDPLDNQYDPLVCGAPP